MINNAVEKRGRRLVSPPDIEYRPTLAGAQAQAAAAAAAAQVKVVGRRRRKVSVRVAGWRRASVRRRAEPSTRARAVSVSAQVPTCLHVASTTLMLLALAVLLGAAVVRPAAAATPEQTLDVGRAINLFSRYGYLTISMRVVPRNDSERWLFREPTVEIFQQVHPEVSFTS
jgi:hypothetical protein